MSDDEKKVIQFPQRGGTPADDLLMGLPQIPEAQMYCGNCGQHVDKASSWVGPEGCPDCLTPREVRFLEQRNELWSEWGDVLRQRRALLAACRAVIAGQPGAVGGLRRLLEILDTNDRLRDEAVARGLAAQAAAQSEGSE